MVVVDGGDCGVFCGEEWICRRGNGWLEVVKMPDKIRRLESDQN